MYDVVIVGSGPAGLTAAIYAGRAKLKTLVIGGALWGGQLMLTKEVENFPGFPEGVLGPDLMSNMRMQAERFGAEFILENATSVDFLSRPLKVHVGNRVYEARAVIVATGASPRWLGLESEARLRGRGVSTCATCDAPFFREKRAIVVGGGDSAIDEALALSKYAREVIIVHRRDELRACELLQEKAFKNDKIGFIWNSIVQEILGKERVEGVKLRNVKTGEESQLACDAVFLAIGLKPNTDLFKRQLEMDERGYIVTREQTKTNIEGVFVAGDAQDPRYRQAITSAGSGCRAALDANTYLDEHPLTPT